MGRLTVPSRQASKNYKQTVVEHPGKLAVAKHDITTGRCGQRYSIYARVYIHLCVILVFIHFIVFLWFPSPVPFHALLLILQSPFYLSILFLCVLPPHSPLAQPELCLDSPSFLAYVFGVYLAYLSTLMIKAGKLPDYVAPHTRTPIFMVNDGHSYEQVGLFS